MHFSLFLSTGLGAGNTRTIFTVAIVVLACLLGAEIAGICILISKMLRARHVKIDKHKYEAYEAAKKSGDVKHYGVAFAFALAAIPQATYTALIVLAALTALMAVVFVVLLIVFRACGYDFATLNSAREEEDAFDTATVEKNREVFGVLWPTAEPEAEEPEEAYDEIDEPEVAVAEEEPFAAFEEEADAEEEIDDSAEEAVEDIEEDAAAIDEPDAEAEELADEPAPEVEPERALVAEVLPAAPAAGTTTATVTTVEEGPVFSDGTRPYKVVEKVVTETVTEVYKEVPVEQQSQQPASSTNDAVLEKLVDLLDYEIRSRREGERAEKAEDEEKRVNAESVPTFASVEAEDADEDEDEDDDALDAEDAKGDEDEDDRDTEEDADGDRFTGNERIIGYNEETECYIVAHYRKSFEAKLIQAQPRIKQYYSELKNALLSYKGTKNRISWTADSFHNGRQAIAKINVKTRSLELYLALDPASLEGTVYRGRDVSSKKKYADTPFQYKLRTPRKFKWAMELIQRVCEEHGLTPIDIERVDYEALYPFDTTEHLVERKLIKEYIREEKPASTFELDPDHVPEVPEEDGTVLPANATFTWEFDNDRMVEPEPEPVVEPEPIPEPEPEPVAEPEPVVEPTPEPAPVQTTVTRETVKVTEMRYTERYYADAQPTYQEIITTTEPMEEIRALGEDIAPDETPVAEETAEAVADETVDAAEAEETEEIADETVAGDVGVVDVWDEEPLEQTEEVYDTAEDEELEEPLFGEGAEVAYEAEETEDDTEEAVEEPVEDGESYEETYEEETEEVEEEPASREALPFRPSFYANRNYYEEAAEEETEELPESEYAEDAEAEEAYGEYEDADYAEQTESYEEVAYGEEEYAEEAEGEAYAQEEEEPVYDEAPSPVKRPPANPSVALIDICAVEDEFENGDVVNLETLKEKHLIVDAAVYLRVDASGQISKQFTVEANHITLNAIFAIQSVGGTTMITTR